MGELDIERLRGERQHNTTFASCLRDNKSLQFTTVSTEMVQPKDIELTRAIDAHPFVPSGDTLLDERCEEIFSIQVAGLAKRLVHTGCKTVVVGISGGLDSTLALLVCVKTFDKANLTPLSFNLSRSCKRTSSFCSVQPLLYSHALIK